LSVRENIILKSQYHNFDLTAHQVFVSTVMLCETTLFGVNLT
jgi:hypothetical protein